MGNICGSMALWQPMETYGKFMMMMVMMMMVMMMMMPILIWTIDIKHMGNYGNIWDIDDDDDDDGDGDDDDDVDDDD